MSLHSLAAFDGKTFKDEVLDLVDRDAAEAWSASKILTWAVENFHPRLTISASFGVSFKIGRKYRDKRMQKPVLLAWRCKKRL